VERRVSAEVQGKEMIDHDHGRMTNRREGETAARAPRCESDESKCQEAWEVGFEKRKRKKRDRNEGL
jgi:hypothetical protein